MTKLTCDGIVGAFHDAGFPKTAGLIYEVMEFPVDKAKPIVIKAIFTRSRRPAVMLLRNAQDPQTMHTTLLDRTTPIKSIEYLRLVLACIPSMDRAKIEAQAASIDSKSFCA